LSDWLKAGLTEEISLTYLDIEMLRLRRNGLADLRAERKRKKNAGRVSFAVLMKATVVVGAIGWLLRSKYGLEVVRPFMKAQ
jgi:hypothetical protein